MKRFLAIVRIVMLGAHTSAIYAAWVAVDLLLRRSTDARRRWRWRVFRAWARGVARIARMRITLTGAAPRPPFLLVANHLGYMDVVVLSSVLDCAYVAKCDVASWPAIGRLCRSMRTVFVDRTRRRDVVRAGARLEEVIAEGEGVVLFAEGTSTGGARVGPFRPSLLEPAAALRLPVHYAALSYRTPASQPPAHLAVCWWGEMTFAKHLFELFQLPSFEASVSFGPEPIVDGDRKALAEGLWRAVSARFDPVLTSEA